MLLAAPRCLRGLGLASSLELGENHYGKVLSSRNKRCHQQVTRLTYYHPIGRLLLPHSTTAGQEQEKDEEIENVRPRRSTSTCRLSNPVEKQRLRRRLCRVFRLLPLGGRVVLLDDEHWAATRQFIQWAGVDPSHIHACQWSHEHYITMQKNRPDGMPADNLKFESMSSFLDDAEQRRFFFRFFWGDFCKTFSGQKDCPDQSPRSDIERLFRNRMMLDHSALAVTFNTRKEIQRRPAGSATRQENSKFLAQKFSSEIVAMASDHGYELDAMSRPISQYHNSNASDMVTLFFFVYQRKG